MGEYVHAYSDYVRHILNKSPSKVTYSFSKSERFPIPQAEPPLNLPCEQYGRRKQWTNSPKKRRKTPQKQLKR